MQFDRTKLTALILYACSKCVPQDLGAVKLHKVLYFSDMLAFASDGTPITGATYRKRPYGPTCDQLLPMLGDLSNMGALKIEEVEYFGFKKKQYIAMQEPDMSLIKKNEIELVDDVIDFVCRNNSAKTVSEFSHNRAWDIADFGEILPYVSVFQIFPTQVSTEAMEWGEQQVDSIASEKSRPNTVDFENYSTFRRRVLEARGA